MEKLTTFYASLDHHQIRSMGSGIWFSLVVTLTKSENEFLSYPVKGVLRLPEQGTHLGVFSGVFHCLNEDGSLGAPVEVRHPEFTFDKGILD
jgi:hypothetical protein